MGIMPDDPPPLPIDYQNPRPGRDVPLPAEPPPERPAVVVPLEFDALLTRSTDHAAVTAIETALRAAKVPTFRSHDGQVAGREITLYVRAADEAKAAPVAAAIFARRQRVKTILPPKLPASDPDAPGELSWMADVD